jgi:hypothetical protein
MVCLCSTPCRQLNALRDDLSTISVMNEEMHAIGRCQVIQDDHPIPLLGLKEPVDPGLAIPGKLQQEFLLVAAMGDVPRMTGYGSRFTLGMLGGPPALTRPFPWQNGRSKPEKTSLQTGDL